MSKSKLSSIPVVGAFMALVAMPMSVFAGATVVDGKFPSSTTCTPDMSICVSASGKTHTVLTPSGNWNAKEDIDLVFTVNDGATTATIAVSSSDNAHCKGGEPDVDGNCAYTQKRTTSFTQVFTVNNGTDCTIVTWTSASKIFKGVVAYDTSSVTTEPCN